MKRKFGPFWATAMLCLGTLLAFADSEVSINEFMAVNSRTLRDENADYSDWIEIFNAGPDAVDLNGWSLTDSTNNLAKWVFPSVNLAPNAYLVVFASGKNRRTPGQNLHTSFTLKADGSYLGLVNAEGAVVSEYAPEYPPQSPDVSYGINQGRKYFFPTPTPGRANGTGYENYVADPKFSQDRGFYDTPFDLVITTETVDATILYTTNGSPPSLSNTNSLTYSGPIRIAGTTVVRAGAFKTGYQPSDINTRTYLFLDDVIRQSPTGQPPPGWPSTWGSNTRDYGMDPDVVNNPKYSGTIKNDLKSVPTFSMVVELKDLFSASTGIYANAGQDGRAWERPCSLELINPNGDKGFHINAGVRIRGGYSRSTGNPKHAFRFFFREVYGAPKLKYPLFGDAGTDTFDSIDLRCSQNYSWSFEGNSICVHLRDQFSRDSQIDMGHNAERGHFYHLYINGQYWGMFNTCERTEASYGESYFGGNKADYDVIKVESGPYTIFATDGNMQAWTRLYNACKAGLTNDAAYEKIQGNNPDGTRNPAYENLVDVDNMIDYMLVIFYGGNLDAPISNFLGNNNPNNWYGVRNRLGTEGFRFFAHDAEHTLLNLSENRTGPYSAGNSSVSTSSPQWVFQKCQANAEFRQRVADRVQRHFFNGGALTPEACAARFRKRMTEIDRAVVGESARWGDSKRNPPLTRDNWLNAANSILNGFFPQRTAVVLGQLKTKKLYPAVNAPSFSQHGGPINNGFLLSISNDAGKLYYALDGSDPRLRGGDVAAGAVSYRGPITLAESLEVRARVLDGTNWSALTAAEFTMIQTYTNLLVTEIMYHPLAEGQTDGDMFEFVELKNANPFEIDLSGVRFTDGISYVFPRGKRLGPGQFALLVSNPTNFAQRYPGVTVGGVFTGHLANGGEKLALVHAVGTPLFSVRYVDQPPWPAAADGRGFSLVAVNPNANPDPDDAMNWRGSSRLGGSPGADDPPSAIGGVIINEILTHTDPPQVDAIELYNPTDRNVDVGNWYLTDYRAEPRKFRIPAPAVMAPGDYLVFDGTDFNPTPGVPPSFSLSSHGEEVFLYSGDEAGNITGYSDGFVFEAAANGVTFGRYTNSVGAVLYPAQRESTLGGPNAGPRVGPLVISEVNYHPAAGDAEFIELKNLTDEPVNLYDPQTPTNTWRLRGVDFSFPADVIAPPRGLLLVVGGDPATFRTRYSVPASVPIFGPYPGVLQDNGELLQLQRPDSPDVDTNGVVVVPWITVDEVRYNDKPPWPASANGQGASLERIKPDAYANDPALWRASFGAPSPGLENDGNRAPRVSVGLAQEVEAAVFPCTVTLQGSATDDGLPMPPGRLTAQWSQVSGPAAALLLEPGGLTTAAALPGIGNYVFRLTVGDGELQAAAEVLVTATRPPVQGTVIPAGSVWKYWDKGTDLGKAWREAGFDDSAWPSGPAELGYGDGGEKTTNSFGPDPNNKYVTTYYRKTFALAGAASVTGATLKVVRDDGIVVYLNGTEVMRDNLPEGDIAFGTHANTAIGGADESTFIEHTVDPRLFKDGPNLFAVEIHQATATSSDISFDLQLDLLAFPSNRAPQVSAGNDLVVTLPASALLEGSFTDDGLPSPPGAVTAAWSAISGPGPVSFAAANLWRTAASFAAPGKYLLRLTVDDGASAVSDDMEVTVAGDVTAPPRIASIELATTPTFAIRIRFQGMAGRRYVVQYRDSLTDSGWRYLTEVQTESGDGLVNLEDPMNGQGASRYYRIVAP